MSEFISEAKRALHLMDLTTLKNDDTEKTIIALCNDANTPVGPTAAICIYPIFIPVARKALIEQGTPDIRIVAVVNFPHGHNDISIALEETRAAIAYGADEIDIVFPYRSLIAGNDKIGFNLVKQCKRVCQVSNVLLKVIIESGKLKHESLIRKASELVINAGADFIKSSTGTVSINATLESAELIMSVIRDMGAAKTVGFKPSGNLRTADDALKYLKLADRLFGKHWADIRHFRFGASGLLSSLLAIQGYSMKVSLIGN